MAILYVVSDKEDAGKTALSVTLAHRLQLEGKRVAVFKPVARDGLTTDSDPDPAIYRKLLDRIPRGWPPHQPQGGLTADVFEGLKAAVDRESKGTVVVAEGSCGLSREAHEQVADALDAKVLIVAGYREDLSASELKPWKELFGERLVGFVINGLTRYKGTDSRTKLLPSLESEGLTCLGVIPEDRRLLGVSVRQVAEHLQGRFIACEERSEALVEHLMIGGMGMDPGELYFGLRDNKAVIFRGDRPDLQMAALNTPTACMVLTKGIEPIEYVKYEAEQEEVSVIVVETDTLETMDSVSTLVEGARFDHPLKLSRFAELLDEYVDVASLLSSAGLA